MNSINSILKPFERFGVHLGLERIEQLLHNLGNPHHNVPIIHVAGTNGKGSVCAYLSSILTQAGYKVGRYTSPHLVDWNERICLNEQPISIETLQNLLLQVQEAINPATESPTQFEVITAAAWLYFAQSQVDIAVVEVGLGGRLDATNVCRPIVSVITSISREHWQQLGSTLPQIAVRKTGQLPYLRPDGKTQVTVAYEDGKPVAIDTILISTQHTASIGNITDLEAVQAKIREDLWATVIEPVFADCDIQPDKETRFLVNPTGKFVIGGPQGDSGLTGRKIIVDTYGGYSRHGGGAFSGKDPTKVDRSAAYACRYVAKNIVAAGLAEKCEVQLSYAIGVARPVSILVETFGTGKVDDDRLLELVKEHFELRPLGIIHTFNLRQLPGERGGRFYQDVAAYGHFGRTDLDLPWEQTDKAALLSAALTQAVVK